MVIFTNIIWTYCCRRKTLFLYSRYNRLNVTARSFITGSALRIQNSNCVKSRSGKTDIEIYFSSRMPLDDFELVPKKYLKPPNKSDELLYILDDGLAKTFVDAIKEDLVSSETPVIEANPGLGYVTKRLLDAGIPRLRVLQREPEFHSRLNVMKKQFPDRLEISDMSITLNEVYAYLVKIVNGSRVPRLTEEELEPKSWDDDPVFKIISALPTSTFISNMSYDILDQTGISLYGRPELYLLIPILTLKSLTSVGYHHYEASTIFFQLLYKWDILGSVSRHGIVPWPSKGSKKSKKRRKLMDGGDYEEVMLIVRITPHKDLATRLMAPSHFKGFKHFVTSQMKRSKSRVIQEMEGWIPGCGPRIIAQGISVFTQFGQLNPHQLLNLFKQFSSWPEYNDCPFIPSMELLQIKREELFHEKSGSLIDFIDTLHEEEAEPIIKISGQ